MKLTIACIVPFLLLTLSPWISLTAQEWTEPVGVSNSPGANVDADFCIDQNGVLHVVWSHGIFSSNNWQILYSKSDDNGESWSNEYNVTQNDTLWMSQPHIDCDSENNLFVTYDYDTYQPQNTQILLKKFNGIQWNDSVLISTNLPGSDYNKILVINDNKVLIGWYWNSKFYYRFYENGELSQIYCPYCDSMNIFLPIEKALTSFQYVKWTGASSSINYSGEKLQYFEQNLENNSWSQPELIDTNIFKTGLGMDLNSNENPQLAFHVQTSVWPNPFSDATYFKFYDGQQWSNDELIVDDPDDQMIAIDQYNNSHLIDREKTLTGFKIVHYRKIDSEWVGYVIDSTSNFCNPTKIIFKNNQIYLIYFRNFYPGEPNSHIMFTKNDITTRIQEDNVPIRGLSVYPNPAQNYININFEIKEPGVAQCEISDFSGRHVKTFQNGKVEKGRYNFIWDGTNEQGNPVNSGMYLCRLYCGRHVMTKSIEIIR